jgi:Cu(I)/Ag(I) efflux system membrane fusion protein
MNTRRNLVFAGVLIIIGVVAYVALQRYWEGMGPNSSSTSSSGAERKIIAYRHPMNPSITADKPLKDEMGMDYIPIYADENAGAMADSSTVKISPNVVNNMGVRVAPVRVGPLMRRVDTVGYVSYNENEVHHVHLRAEGWIENLTVKFTGARVQQGDLLFEIYSPKLVNAQEEYLQALRIGNQGLAAAARQRLVAVGVPDAQIDRLRKTRKAQRLVQNYAHQAGVVRELNIREGMFVEPSTDTMSLVDLSSVWVIVDVFAQQSNWAAVGQQAEMRLPSFPGKVWRGTVDYIYPSLDPTTRALKLRLQFDNPDEQLRPNSYAEIAILLGPTPDVLSIPRAAVIRTEDEQRVIVALGEGRFAPRRVQTGIEVGEEVEIKQGLVKGEEVVVSGQFLIDSESSLKAGFQRLTTDATSTMSKAASKAEVVISVGVINSVDNSRLNISHEPITSVGWPAMTMDFRLEDPALAGGIKPGDFVQFEFTEEQGSYVIHKVTPATKDKK